MSVKIYVIHRHSHLQYYLLNTLLDNFTVDLDDFAMDTEKEEVRCLEFFFHPSPYIWQDLLILFTSV
jgi:hypothetical protein